MCTVVALYSPCTVVPMPPLFFRPLPSGNVNIFDYKLRSIYLFPRIRAQQFYDRRE